MFNSEQRVEFGGESLTLAIDFRTIDLIEESVGESMPAVMAKLSGDPPTGVAAKIVWAMLRRHHPDLKLDLVGALMLGPHRNVIAGGMGELLSRAMNLGDEKPTEGGTVQWSLRNFLVEWVGLGGSPAEFWKQTPKSYVAVMEGMAKAASREVDIAITTGWHAAIFALSGYAGKLQGKSLSDYLISKPERPEKDEERLSNARLIHFFNSQIARGADIKVEKVTRH